MANLNSIRAKPDSASSSSKGKDKERRITGLDFKLDELANGPNDAISAIMINTLAQLQNWVTKDPTAVLDALSQFRLQIAEDLTEFKEYQASTDIELTDTRTETDIVKA